MIKAASTSRSSIFPLRGRGIRSAFQESQRQRISGHAFARDDLLELVPLLTPPTTLNVLGLSAAELTPPSATEDGMKDFDEKHW